MDTSNDIEEEYPNPPEVPTVYLKEDGVITLEKLLMFEEGLRLEAYYDSEGYPTIGIGHKLSANKYEDLGNWDNISMAECKDMFNKDINSVLTYIKGSPFKEVYNNLDNDRRVIIESMCFQMGIASVSRFHKTWKYLELGLYNLASEEMLNSKWAKQTPQRALRHSEVIKSGSLQGTYGNIL